jgi:hypothetical protein
MQRHRASSLLLNELNLKLRVSESPSLKCTDGAQQRNLTQLPFSTTWISERCSRTQEIPLHLWHKPKALYLVHKSLHLDSKLSQVNVLT